MKGQRILYQILDESSHRGVPSIAHDDYLVEFQPLNGAGLELHNLGKLFRHQQVGSGLGRTCRLDDLLKTAGLAFQHGFKPVAAIGADKFIRVLGTGDVQHPHLQIGTGKQRQTALRCLLACFVRVIAQHHFVGVLRQQLDLLRRQSRAAGTDSGIKPGFVHRDDIHIPFAEDIPLGR